MFTILSKHFLKEINRKSLPLQPLNPLKGYNESTKILFKGLDKSNQDIQRAFYFFKLRLAFRKALCVEICFVN